LGYATVTVTVTDDLAPVLGNLSGDLWTDRWIAGPRSVSFDASNNTGINRLRRDPVRHVVIGRSDRPEPAGADDDFERVVRLAHRARMALHLGHPPPPAVSRAIRTHG
jgi:hypothetical protein